MDPFLKPKATKLLCQLLLGSEPVPPAAPVRTLFEALGEHVYIAHTYLYLHI